jgi:hypothetical protein
MDGDREQIISRARLGGDAESVATAINGLRAGAAVFLRENETFKHRLLKELGEIGGRMDQIATDLLRISHGIEEPAATHRLANRGAEPASAADAEQLQAIEGRA